ncbi:MAG: heat-inducible transcriptional repressor HrcA [Actinomycetota bacterium]|nr:heat-inducible transcriptional repressor HrcA [Actinomycetota bacterium]
MPALDGRKEKILIAVVEDYIKSAEPISSQRIVENHNIRVSSATVRSELSSLDKSGHLFQPHTSAGRIPTDKGYRYYVNVLTQMYKERASFEESALLKTLIETGNEMDGLIREASNILCRLTNMVSFVNAPSFKESRLKHIDLIMIDNNSLLMVIITNTGRVFKKAVNIDFHLTEEALEAAEKTLNEKLNNSNLKEIAIFGQNLIELPLGQRKIADIVMTHILNLLLVGERDFLIEGASNILLQPEFKNTGLAVEILDGLKDGELISDLLTDGSALGQTVVRIGAENYKEEMKGCSIVFGSYGFGEVRLGVIGIVGPVRLDYVQGISAVNAVIKRLNSFCSLFNHKREI